MAQSPRYRRTKTLEENLSGTHSERAYTFNDLVDATTTKFQPNNRSTTAKNPEIRTKLSGYAIISEARDQKSNR